MASRRASRKVTLREGLDKDVYQIVKSYIDNHNTSASRTRTYNVYDWIQRSNSSLKRRTKAALEDSIERVLGVLRNQESDVDEIDSLEGDFEPVEQDAKPPNKTSKSMNDILTSTWSSRNGTPVVEGTKSRRTDASNVFEEPAPKRQKREGREKESRTKISSKPPSNISLASVGGVDDVKFYLMEQLILPMLDHEDAQEVEEIPRGILLHGPPGCGKTFISRAIASKLGVPFIEILGPSVVSGMSGESEKQIREHFQKAKEMAPSIIFIDEIDVLAPKRDSAQSQMEKRIVAQFLVSMDGLALDGTDDKPVIVLAATNRPDSLDPALRRGGRFDVEINMGVPNEKMREQILQSLTRNKRISSDVKFDILARKTSGYVGADLRSLIGKARGWSGRRYREALRSQAAELYPAINTDFEGSEVDRKIELLITRVKDKEAPRPPGFEEIAITMADFEAVLPSIQPSSKREGFATIPDVSWSDVGALESVRRALNFAIVEPISSPERYRKLKISPPTGCLLWGPPGCGKTLLAKAAAAESKANYISVKGPELFNKYVGESERAVRQVFMRARSSVPVIIFFDEIDALVPRRDDSSSESTTRVVNTFLTELDGLTTKDGIYVIGATNRLDIIDKAMLRPGRLERVIYVGLPGPAERVEILAALLRKKLMDPSFAEVARACDGFSGADLASLLEGAGMKAIERKGDTVVLQDFVDAKTEIKPSVDNEKSYKKLEKELSRS